MLNSITGLYEHKKTTSITEKDCMSYLFISIRQVRQIKGEPPTCIYILVRNFLCIETRTTVEAELKEGEWYSSLAKKCKKNGKGENLKRRNKINRGMKQ